MPHIYLCFLWHMHQPFYKDLVSGEYKLPWTRLHALKDYYGMVNMLEEFPRVHQTFNLVPSMMVQVEEYAAGTAADPFLQLVLKPAESLTEWEREFLLKHSFHAYAPRMIYRYPRYGELYDAWQAQRRVDRAGRLFGAQDFRDLQVISQLAWFDEDFQENDPEVRQLIDKGRNYSIGDQSLVGELERKIVGAVLPAYERAAAAGRIEISTTPFYHPILPLLCDSNIAATAHPNVPLPPQFRYPGDAQKQLELAAQYCARELGAAPAGLWPSEGSVSDEVFHLAAAAGFKWTATDSGVLARTLGRAIGVDSLYRPYRWKQRDSEISVIFRDHFLSDLIGFVYSKMEAKEAAADFVKRIRENCHGILAGGRDALVPIILDGENAWEYYDRNGRPFLRELYRRISEDQQMSAVTVSEALARIEPAPLDRIFPGSWINANFDVWIGAEEDNRAWAQLLRARQAYDDTAAGVSEAQRRLAYEELLIAEGSDWCWWYGPEHESANRVEFDQLYRQHLANVYCALSLTPPEELSRPILRMSVGEVHTAPTGPIHPTIDGEVTSYFEWLGAGVYRVDERSGSMHGKKFLLQEFHFGSDGSSLFLRADFNPAAQQAMSQLEARLTVYADGDRTSSVALRIDHGRAHATDMKLVATATGDVRPVEVAFRKTLELRVALDALGVSNGGKLRFQFSLWQGGLPVDAIPQQGWLDLALAEPPEWGM